MIEGRITAMSIYIALAVLLTIALLAPRFGADTRFQNERHV